jgi:DNA-binding response OmpR family regulator
MTTIQETSMPETTKTSSKTDRYHVLVVDDDREIAETLRCALAAEGYHVSVATDGNQGVAYAEAKNPDLLILDMMMPRRSGFLVLERLRQYSDEPIPVIMITGNEGLRHREYAEMLGVSDYIHKPFTMDRLLTSVTNLLEH